MSESFRLISLPMLVARNGYHQDMASRKHRLKLNLSKSLLLLAANDNSPFDAVALPVYA